jgi:putative flippase GtrA
VPAPRAHLQFARYVLVGGSAFVADFCTLVLLREGLGLGVFWAAGLAFLVGMRVNYALATRFVFTERRPRGAHAEFLLYAAVGGVSLGLNQLLMWALTTHLHVHYALAKPCTAALVLGWSFGARRLLLTRREAPARP